MVFPIELFRYDPPALPRANAMMHSANEAWHHRTSEINTNCYTKLQAFVTSLIYVLLEKVEFNLINLTIDQEIRYYFTREC